jgi:hypothetical protein
MTAILAEKRIFQDGGCDSLLSKLGRNNDLQFAKFNLARFAEHPNEDREALTESCYCTVVHTGPEGG